MKTGKKINGYLTVEAGFILPVVFMIFILIIYFCFYLFNQCVVYQDCFLGALRGSQVRMASDSSIEQLVQNQMSKLLDNQLFDYQKETKVNVSILKIDVGCESNIKMDFSELIPYKEKILRTCKSASATRLNPIYLIRMKR